MASTQGDGGGRADLESRFWVLVLLAKLVVLVTGGGILLAIGTPYQLAGGALVVIGIGIAVRWIHLFRRTRGQLASGGTT